MRPSAFLSQAVPSMPTIPTSIPTPTPSQLQPPSASNSRDNRDSGNNNDDGDDDFLPEDPSDLEDRNPQLLPNLAEVLLHLSNSIAEDKNTPKVK